MIESPIKASKRNRLRDIGHNYTLPFTDPRQESDLSELSGLFSYDTLTLDIEAL
jgi:hypothetical protein